MGILMEPEQTYLPLLHLILLRLVLLHQILKHFAQAFRVRLQRWNHIFDRPLDENTVNHTETFAVARKWC